MAFYFFEVQCKLLFSSFFVNTFEFSVLSRYKLVGFKSSYPGVLQNGPTTLFKKETPVQLFSCHFCKIIWNTFFKEHTVRLLLRYYAVDHW